MFQEFADFLLKIDEMRRDINEELWLDYFRPPKEYAINVSSNETHSRTIMNNVYYEVS